MVETVTKVTFVEATANRIEMRVCEIAERTYTRGERLQIVAIDEEQAARLDDLLWTYKPDNFVPHGFWKGNDSESAGSPGFQKGTGHLPAQ